MWLSATVVQHLDRNLLYAPSAAAATPRGPVKQPSSSSSHCLTVTFSSVNSNDKRVSERGWVFSHPLSSPTVGPERSPSAAPGESAAEPHQEQNSRRVQKSNFRWGVGSDPLSGHPVTFSSSICNGLGAGTWSVAGYRRLIFRSKVLPCVTPVFRTLCTYLTTCSEEQAGKFCRNSYKLELFRRHRCTRFSLLASMLPFHGLSVCLSLSCIVLKRQKILTRHI